MTLSPTPDNNGPEHAALQPFRDAVHTWRGMGWLGTIPLPINQKSPPPTNYTGDRSTRVLYADDQTVADWLESGTYNDGRNTVGNIGMALGFPVLVDGTEYQVIGIDVDDYDDKNGGAQLKSLESQLGALPDAPISSARDDGVSGIRFFRVPAYTAKGDRLEFVGSADTAIEVIQYKHRFAVMFPSINPKTGTQYRIYPPGQAPDGINYRDEIPDPATLPELTDMWVGFLRDKTGAAIRAIDTESSPGELNKWANDTFNAGDEASACTKMLAAVDKWRDRIADDAASHDKVRNGHWEIVRMAGFDGCTGWHWAMEELTNAWTGDVTERNKRSVGELCGELFRELTGAFRKTKAELDLRVSQGKPSTPPHCIHSPQLTMTGPNMTAPQANSAPTGLAGRAPDDVHSGHVRMAHRMANAYGNRLLYVHGIGWHYWDKTRWQADTSEARVKRAAMSVIAGAINSVIGNGTDEAKRLRSDARKCESASGLEGMIRVARALKPFAATVDDIDADPYLLNVANGTVDLHTGTLRPHNPADRITKICAGAYLGADDPASDSQAYPARVGANWEAFLERVQPDDDMRGFVQRLIGVGLIGRIKEHILPILTGKGANGKSVFCEAIQFALGDYAITAEPDLLMHREGVHPTGEMDLLGCRWVFVSESEKDRRLAETTVKRLTADSKVRARRMRQDFVEFKASHTLMLVTNHKPKVSGDDMAIWRRLRVVPFGVHIPQAEQDKSLGEKLQLEADAVITWAISGLMAYLSSGLNEPKQVVMATEIYHQESDAIGRFIADRCVIGPDQKVEPKRLHQVWCAWQTEDGCEAVGLKAFNVAMEERGYCSGKPSNGKRFRIGIGLKAIQDRAEFAGQNQ